MNIVEGAQQGIPWVRAYRASPRHSFCVREEPDGTFWAVGRTHMWSMPLATNPYDDFVGPCSSVEEAYATALMMGFEVTVSRKKLGDV